MSTTRRAPVLPRRRAAVPVALLALLAACSGTETVEPDPELAPLVGDWEAVALRVTSAPTPTVSLDLIESGASFTLNVQPSGQYTAILFFAGQDQTEIGQLEVAGDQITLRPSVPAGRPTTTGTYTLQGGLLVVEGATEFDFNLDGTTEPAEIRMELQGR